MKTSLGREQAGVRRPAFRAFLLIASGIFILHQPHPWPVVLAAACVLAIPLVPWCRADKVLAVVLLATGSFMEVSSRTVERLAEQMPQANASLVGIVSSPPRRAGGYVSTDLALLDSAGRQLGVSVRAYISDTTLVAPRRDTLVVHGTTRPLGPPLNPGDTDWSRLLKQRGIIGRIWSHRAEHHPAPPVASWRDSARRHVESTLSETGGREGALAMAMLIGVRDLLDQETMASFRDAGIVHVLSISGFHVGIVAALLYAVGGALLPGYRIPSLVALAGVGAYVALVGWYAPVLRAGIMSAIVLLGLMLGRRAEGINSLGLAGLILLVTQPRWLWDPGFQLSFAATLGILVFMPPMLTPVRRWRRSARWCAGSVLTSLSAQLGVLPILLVWFRQWPTYSLFANVPAALLATLLIGASLATSLAQLVWTELAGWCHRLTELSARGLLVVADTVASLPMAVMGFGDARLWLLTIGWAAIVGARVGRLWGRPLAPSLVGTMGAVGAWLVWSMGPWQAKVDRVSFLHVPRGNCVVVEEPAATGLLETGSGRGDGAARAASDHLRFRRASDVVMIGASSVRPARSSSVDTLRSDLEPTRAVLPAGALPSRASNPMPTAWSEANPAEVGTRFSLMPLGIGNESLDGLLVRSTGGLQVLIAGDGGWRADAQCATHAAVESTDVLYLGPWRDMAPSHLLLRRAAPRLVVIGGGTVGENDLIRDLTHAGYRVASTQEGAVTVECASGQIRWRQHGRP